MKKKIAFDMILNIVATAIPTVVLQLLLLPSLSRNMTDASYGLLVTILSLLNIIPSTLGNVLNNIRLIIGKETEGENKKNYNAILLIMAIINIIFMSIFTMLYDKEITIVSMMLTLITSLLLLIREYYSVAFRIKINYVSIFVSNVIMVVGYGVGYVVFLWTKHWQYLYIFGYGFSIVYIFIKSKLWKEPFTVDEEMMPIAKQTVQLTFATFLARVTTYADKLLIFPVLGGAVVSVYYAATLFGKVVSMAINPISSVMLSYLSKMTRKNDKTFKLAVGSSTIVCIAGYLVCVLISRPVLSYLYPQFVDEAMKYILITTGTMVLSALNSIVNPFVLKFFDMKWQIAINGIYVIVYVGISMALLATMGLYGFCLGTLIAAGIKLLFMLFIYARCSEANIIQKEMPK